MPEFTKARLAFNVMENRIEWCARNRFHLFRFNVRPDVWDEINEYIHAYRDVMPAAPPMTAYRGVPVVPDPNAGFVTTSIASDSLKKISN